MILARLVMLYLILGGLLGWYQRESVKDIMLAVVYMMFVIIEAATYVGDRIKENK